jgi:hypothetical protein
MALGLLMAGFRLDIDAATIPRISAVSPTINERKIRIPPVPASPVFGGNELAATAINRNPSSNVPIVLIPVHNAADAIPSPPAVGAYGLA